MCRLSLSHPHGAVGCVPMATKLTVEPTRYVHWKGGAMRGYVTTSLSKTRVIGSTHERNCDAGAR